MSNELGLSLMLGPPLIIVALIVTFRVLGPGRPTSTTPVSVPADMSRARLDVAQSVASGMLAGQVVEDETLAEVMALKDQRRPTHAVKLLRQRTGLELGDAKRLVDRLP
ncbi:hypothetical protein [Aeromicrobium ginsengisoli]|uniref:Ribosomal protein L7/L12 C-terminal domain-containing protein n=1 Tax=Aeromicrobium ginsengisoli TaxID=363867 RepID=A0A5M4FGK6_9ACTN|nr:hypothetical protein [Aeromicrobium ginsengisoli]KAA1399210.1 hypothetical protein ESP70_000075 [Aeromicrobium ginsengisoli]